MAKKKSRRKKPVAPGVDPNEKRRERLEAKRAARAEAERKRQRQRQRERWVRRGVFALLFVGAVWFVFLRTAGPTEIGGHEVEQFLTAGSGDHTTDPVSYESTPPVSGRHAPGPSPCGVFAEQLPNEIQVHTLEHGAVGIQFDPTLAPEDITAIEDIVRSYDSHVFSAPYSGMETPITVSSWGKLMRLEELDEDAIREYVDAFKEKGPEKEPCDTETDQPFGAQPSPQPSPQATVEVGGDQGDGGDGGDKGGKGDGGGKD